MFIHILYLQGVPKNVFQLLTHTFSHFLDHLGPVAISCIETCFKDESALLKHELAYCLGQMQDTAAVPTLTEVLRDLNQEPMVRHEAGT